MKKITAIKTEGTFDNYIVTITVDLNNVGDLECVDESEFESDLHDALADKFEAEFGSRPHITSGSDTLICVEPADYFDGEADEYQATEETAQIWFAENFMEISGEVFEALL